MSEQMLNQSQTLDFEATTYGKWILAGEHAVLRGHPAIIFPVHNKCLHLHYSKTAEKIRADFSGEFGDEIQFLFWNALKRAIEILNIPHGRFTGKVSIENTIPVGAGMGASAALCVAIGKLLVHLNFFRKANLLEFCRQLENLFHDESSGADIAVAIAGNGLYFSRTGGMHSIKTQWHPQWYLSYSNKLSATAHCVKKVKELWRKNPELAEKIDQDMANCVLSCEAALQSSFINTNTRLEALTQAIQVGYDCFKRWGLCDGIIEKHIQTLLKAGALAAKPTGAGAGGFVLSLWEKTPKKPLQNCMIRL